MAAAAAAASACLCCTAVVDVWLCLLSLLVLPSISHSVYTPPPPQGYQHYVKAFSSCSGTLAFHECVPSNTKHKTQNKTQTKQNKTKQNTKQNTTFFNAVAQVEQHMDAFQHRCLRLPTVPRVTRHARARARVMSCLTMPPPPPSPCLPRPCPRVQGMARVQCFVVAAGAGVHWGD